MTQAHAHAGDNALGEHGSHGHAHPPHLAHHFDTPQQQFESGKLGMWVFLATEILMFGGLFCAYSVYRANHPEVFLYAHHYLDTMWGAINTVVLLVSSFTMAWGVRAAALGQKNLLVAMLFVTLLGGLGFLCIKAIEYEAKFSHDLTPGRFNVFSPQYEHGAERVEQVQHLEHEYAAKFGHGAEEHATGAAHGDAGHGEPADAEEHPTVDPVSRSEGHSVAESVRSMAEEEAHPVAPAATLAPGEVAAEAAPPPAPIPAEQSLITPANNGPAGLNPHARLTSDTLAAAVPHGVDSFAALPAKEQQRIGIFFSIYWLMTGLHGIHVLIGLGIISWLMYRAGAVRDRAWILPTPLILTGVYLLFLWWIVSPETASVRDIPVNAILGVLGGVVLVLAVAWTALRLARRPADVDGKGDFGPEYFAPIDIGGLYWHLVDLIWIFLFPLLYLIH